MGLTREQARLLGLEREHPKMSKPERLMSDWLTVQKVRGVIRDFGFETVNLRLAEKCFYRPDHVIEMFDGSRVFVECKGSYMRDDGVVKFKVAAEMYADPFFLAVYKKGWKIRQLPGPGHKPGLEEFFKGI